MSANEFFQTQNLTLGAPVSSPQMATVNSLIITGGLLGSAAPSLLPAIKSAAAPVITIGLQNAPQINQAVNGFITGPPGASSSPYENAGILLRHGFDELQNARGGQ